MNDSSQIGTDRLKHLEFIQAVVGRLANSSLLVRGWSLTILAAFLAILATRFQPRLAAAALVPVLAFWLLDSYFLASERKFRRLYEDACRPDSQVPSMSMDLSPYASRETLLSAATSTSVLLFYAPLILLLVVLLAVTVVVG
ncbi:hypothetical protein [Micromonospora sp. L31]|uniref:hypothetical protein n=1 Tax=Micromonospora sp. L31 TaxID=3452213 RepID=UPI003F89D796